MTNEMTMPRLGLSMAERYDITLREPLPVRAILLGSDPLMLNLARALEDRGIGAACLAPGAEALAAQDNMFTMLVRDENGSIERVVQNIRLAFDPLKETDAVEECAAEEIDYIFVHDDAGSAERVILSSLTDALTKSGRRPEIYAASDLPDAEKIEELSAELGGREVHPLIVDGLCGAFDEKEAALQRTKMNYMDDYLVWAQPKLKLATDGGTLPDADSSDYEAAFAKKARVFDALVFLGAAAGFMSGKDSFAEVMKDKALRAFIARAFSEEILPNLPWPREAIAPEVISAFERLEDSANSLPLIGVGHHLMRRLPITVLPSLLHFCEENFEAPKLTTLALAAAVMLYAGVREEDGVYAVRRGDKAFALADDEEVFEDFSRLAHDMPAETLCYAILADRALWNCDLREADGLELRLMGDIYAIQRAGFADTLKRRMEEKE